MAARRLILVLVLLLAASILAASIAPDRTGRLVGIEADKTEEETTSTEATTTSTSTAEEATTSTEDEPGGAAAAGAGSADEPATGGVALTRRIEASEKRPETVTALVGDQLSLSVGANPAREVAIPSLGLTDFAGDDAPARFDVLLRDPGLYAVTDAEDPAVILGRIRVRAAEPEAGNEKRK